MSDETPRPEPTPGPSVQLNFVAGNDALNVMIDIWLCGMRAGAFIASSMHHPDADDERLYAEASAFAKKFAEDPLRLEEVRDDVRGHIARGASR